MTKKLKTYICGPMRGIKYFNADMFFDVQWALNAVYDVSNPAAHDEDMGFDPYQYPKGECDTSEFDLKAALQWDLEQVAGSDFITLLPGWEKSSGVRAELALAFALGIPVREWDAEDRRLSYNLGKDRWLASMAPDVPTPVTAPYDDGDLSRLSTESYVFPTVFPAGEVRTTSATGGEKGMKLQRFDLIPIDALTQVAEHYGVGARKYDDNQWRKGYEWSKSYAALQRHANAFWGGEDFDSETGSNHMAAVAWHALALLTFFDEFREFDDRFKRD